MSFVEEIKTRILLNEVVEGLGYHKNRTGKYKCIFHDEKTASMKIYENNTFHCFGCNANGSVIDFVMKYYNLTFVEACKKIDDDFKLNIFNKNPTEEQVLKAQIEKLKRIEKKREKEKVNKLRDFQMQKVIILRRIFWQNTHNMNFFPIAFLDRLLDDNNFPVDYDIEQMLKCLYKRWRKEMIKIASKYNDSKNNT